MPDAGYVYSCFLTVVSDFVTCGFELKMEKLHEMETNISEWFCIRFNKIGLYVPPSPGVYLCLYVIMYRNPTRHKMLFADVLMGIDMHVDVILTCTIHLNINDNHVPLSLELGIGIMNKCIT